MAYTPQVYRKIQTETFSGLVNDANHNAMGVLGSTIQTIDATGTPVTSPATVNTTQTLTVPSNAVTFTVVSTTNPVQVSEDSTQTAYFTVPAGTPWTFDCARMSTIYLKTGSSTVVNFYFSIV